MYRERLVECADCGDRFKIVYDSRKEKQDEYKCKCGKFVCHPDYFGSFSYERSGNYKDVPYAEQENKREYYDEDYIKLTDEEQKLLNEIDKIGKSLDSYSNNTNECYVRLELFGCSKSNEGLTISFETRLESWGNAWSEREIKDKNERLLDGLNRFKDVITKVNNGEIDLDNPRKIYNDDSLEWKDGNRTQQSLYDYELCC